MNIFIQENEFKNVVHRPFLPDLMLLAFQPFIFSYKYVTNIGMINVLNYEFYSKPIPGSKFIIPINIVCQ